MSIRVRILLIVIPLILCVLILTSTISALIARSGIVSQAIKSYSFKSNQFEQYVVDQWKLLEENQLTNKREFINSFYESLLSKAKEISPEGESIFALDLQKNQMIFNTQVNSLSDVDIDSLKNTIYFQSTRKEANAEFFQDMSADEFQNNIFPRAWINKSFTIDGEKFVGYYFLFPHQNLLFVVASTRSDFFRPVTEIIFYTLILLVVAIFISISIIVYFSKSLVKPLKSMVDSMRNIIDSSSFDQRVEIVFRDEVGELSQTFNVMITELDYAYQQIKQYAFSAVVAKKNESKIRNIFQKYVPVNVINSLFQNPTSMLKGENRNLSLMFTDIRSFTTISEKYKPDMLVSALNSYFEILVDIITEQGGVIDKYIGDAVMAFFGAPVELENSPKNALEAGLQIARALEEFNKNLAERKLPTFLTGVGINYGLVTIGNIGTDKKMDYTVIGDTVNFASRLEGLTKEYKQTIIYSDSVRACTKNDFIHRLVDVVQVKGKTSGERIYSTKYTLSKKDKDIIEIHNEGVKKYLARKFDDALVLFKKLQKKDSKDYLAKLYLQRCSDFIKNPPSKDWNGVYVMHTK